MKKNIVLLLIAIFVLFGCAKKQPTYTDTVVMLDDSQNNSYEVKLRTYDWLNYYMDEYEYDDKTILTIKYIHEINESKYSVVKERMDQFAENEVLKLIETYKAGSLVLDDSGMGMKYMMESQELENQELKVTIDYRNNY